MRADVRASVGAQRGTGWRDNGLISHTQRAAHRNYGQHAVGVGADDATVQLWSINFGTPLSVPTDYPDYRDITGTIGIISTPVVDRVTRSATDL